MLTFPAPAKINGEALTAELATAGYPDADVYLRDSELVIVGPDDTDRAGVKRVVDAHVPPPPPPNPQDEFRKAVEAATTLAALKAAILGSTGPGAQPRNR